MAHIRVFRHYIHTPYLIMAGAELCLLAAAAFLAHWSRFGEFPAVFPFFWSALILSMVLVSCMAAMGVYEARLREGFTGMMLRTAVSIFLLGTMAIAMISYIAPIFDLGRYVLLYASVQGFVILLLFRITTQQFVSEDALKKRVLVLGTGHRALKIASRMRRKSDQRAFVLVGFLSDGSSEDKVTEFGARTLNSDTGLLSYCQANDIDEIVVAVDERRRNREPGSPGLPIDELVECRLSGIEVCEVQAFIEREACKVDVDLLQPSWMVFSDGFVSNGFRDAVKRSFDIGVSLLLLSVTWPIMVLFALFISIEGRFRDPVLYKQERVGLDGEPFYVMKFRSMQVDAEAQGAVWAMENDPRVTKIGAFMRKTRIDELPQLFNVLKGDMSFVGPRPERPVFVEDLDSKLPYYAQRHRVKPGITGWAQLCYPYGASVQDAKEKLQYDLYYLKNHSILLDLIVLIQTVEVVLVGDGAR